MRALIQRVKEASVTVNGTIHNRIGSGLLIFLGVAHTDTESDAQYLARRCADLRIFEDTLGKMNLSIHTIAGEALVVSQFTLYADTRRGNRPSFTDAASPTLAEHLYESFIKYLRQTLGSEHVKEGVFRAMMDIQLVNDGPVTILIESKEFNN
jgi:D-aminoacyl-tRNA deacylase